MAVNYTAPQAQDLQPVAGVRIGCADARATRRVAHANGVYFLIPSSSTSKVNVAFGGIGPPGVPRSP